ncbi:helix-turn-helix domain-containing protein [Massilia sp. TWR1-2-2]|uniref:helix-turn-helix domain-containing protein n=1 Tax=Massilia sp. TWR1-2-2 TaxID=2804584 RepID=UPI003CEA722A
MPLRPSQNPSTFSRRLREVRLRSDLPQDKLGVLAGLEESSASARMSRYENGVHEPPHRFVEALAKVLGVPAAYFYCGDDRLAEIMLAYSDMPEIQRQALRQRAAELLR